MNFDNIDVMKKLFVSSFAIIVLLVMMSFQLIRTQLRVFVLDDLGKHREGVEVSLYHTAEDYNNSKPAFGPLLTDKKGRVIFQDVPNGPFYIEAVKDDYSNGLTGQLTDKLQEGRINKMNLVISE